MDDKLLFDAVDPLDNHVVLSERRYNEHIIGSSGHADIMPLDIQSAIEKPFAIYPSSQYQNRNVYFARSVSAYPRLYAKVAVEIDPEKKRGEVVTAFPTKSIAGGIDLERGLIYFDINNKL